MASAKVPDKYRDLFSLIRGKARKESNQMVREAMVKIGPEAILPLVKEMAGGKIPSFSLSDFVEITTCPGASSIPGLVASTALGFRATYLVTLALGALRNDAAIESLKAIAQSSKGKSAVICSVSSCFADDPEKIPLRLSLLFGLPDLYKGAGGLADRLLASNKIDFFVSVLKAVEKRGNYTQIELLAGFLGISRDTKQALPLLIRLLDESYGSKCQIAAALSAGFIGDPAAIEPLQKLLTDENCFVRESGRLALAAIQHDKKIEIPISIQPVCIFCGKTTDNMESRKITVSQYRDESKLFSTTVTTRWAVCPFPAHRDCIDKKRRGTTAGLLTVPLSVAVVIFFGMIHAPGIFNFLLLGIPVGAVVAIVYRKKLIDRISEYYKIPRFRGNL